MFKLPRRSRLSAKGVGRAGCRGVTSSSHRGSQWGPATHSALVLAVAAVVIHGVAEAQVPPLPEGAKTHWKIKAGEEIITWVLFDPALVSDRLPQGLRFVTLAEIAEKVPATTTPGQALHSHLAAHVEHRHYATSFVEIWGGGKFSIDGREPAWPENGGVGLWFAPVLAEGLRNELARGGAVLTLLFLVPDSAYVQYMKDKGHYAEYGDVRLRKDESNAWKATMETSGLRVESVCSPVGEETKEDPGYQTLYAPGEAVKRFLVISTPGGRVRKCPGEWRISGTHPLARAVVLPLGLLNSYSSSQLLGGVYDLPRRGRVKCLRLSMLRGQRRPTTACRRRRAGWAVARRW